MPREELVDETDRLSCYEYVDVKLRLTENVEIPDDAIGVSVEYQHNSIIVDEYIVRYLRPVERGETDE